MNDEAVYRTAPATPGLLIICCREINVKHNFAALWLFVEIPVIAGVEEGVPSDAE